MKAENQKLDEISNVFSFVDIETRENFANFLVRNQKAISYKSYVQTYGTGRGTKPFGFFGAAICNIVYTHFLGKLLSSDQDENVKYLKETFLESDPEKIDYGCTRDMITVIDDPESVAMYKWNQRSSLERGWFIKLCEKYAKNGEEMTDLIVQADNDGLQSVLGNMGPLLAGKINPESEESQPLTYRLIHARETNVCLFPVFENELINIISKRRDIQGHVRDPLPEELKGLDL